MTTADQLQVVTVLITLAAVLVALFGDWIKSRLFCPKLTLSLSSRADGVPTKARLISPDGTSRLEDARYWFLAVSTEKRWPVANDVRVCLTQLELPDSSGAMQTVWASSELPIIWDFQEIRPLQIKVGPPAEAALISVVKDKWLELHPVVVPNNLPVRFAGDCHFVATFQALSVEADSNLLRVFVDWDGKWSDSEAEMRRHLVIRAEQSR